MEMQRARWKDLLTVLNLVIQTVMNLVTMMGFWMEVMSMVRHWGM